MFGYEKINYIQDESDFINFEKQIFDFELLLNELREIKYYAQSTYDKHQYYENDIFIYSIHKIHNLYRGLKNIIIEISIGNIGNVYDEYIGLQASFIITRYIPKHIYECLMDKTEIGDLKNTFNILGNTNIFKKAKKLRDDFSHDSNVDVFYNGIPIQNILTMSEWLLEISKFLIESAYDNLEKIFGNI